MIPGAVHPHLMAGGHWDSHYMIGHALRLRGAQYLSRAFASAGDRTKWTLRFLVKKTKNGASQHLLSSNISGTTETEIFFNSSDQLECHFCGGPAEGLFQTSRVFRDPGAWLDIVIVWDSNNATVGDRARCYINGDRVTSFTSYTNVTTAGKQSDLGQIGNVNVGRWIGASNGYLDGNIAEVIYAPGQAYDGSYFGRICPEKGHWEPIKFSGSLAGTNAFFLDFSDGASQTTLGYDKSGNGNHWTLSWNAVDTASAGINYDWLTDTPTNNFCTFNPLRKWAGDTDPALATYLNAGCLNTIANVSGTLNTAYVGTLPVKSGKWYWEITLNGASVQEIGIADVSQFPSVTLGSTGTWGYRPNTGQKSLNGVTSAYAASSTTNDVIGVCLDIDNNTLEFLKQTGGVGAFVSLGLITGLALPSIGSFAPFETHGNLTNGVSLNCGQRPLKNTTPPAGSLDICAKNLPEPPVLPRDIFKAVADSGANIQTSLAAARSGWSDYIEIFKRRDTTAEGWRWRFSDDTANYLDSSSTAAKAAFPALSGSSYGGYALRVGAAYGVATGRLSHTNGAADTVADGLATTRKLVILKNEANGSWFVYHPDLTAGKLLYLEQSANETTDATISGVNSSGFTVAAALATGTYRWISIAEKDGLVKLGKYSANASADGPFLSAGHRSAFHVIKCMTGTTGNWRVADKARSPNNMATQRLWLNLTSIEDTSSSVDLVSNGLKVRDGSGVNDANFSGATYVYLSIGDLPLKYTNAR
ncbi:MAG: hypothetical protein EG825_07750 [Rhodocyclaceae bacterium]|nr:hypothetical protein [Rhodocyclaceae bacterium]